MKPTKLLNDDGAASMATMIMLSHHAFRRDLGWFAQALAKLDAARIDHLRSEWSQFCGALHGHHEKEDADIFPHFRAQLPAMAPTLDRLSAQHAAIDPLLTRGEQAFAKLPEGHEAGAVVRELQSLLDTHLDEEEAGIIPLLRGAKQFPSPNNDDEAAMFASGFAWAMHGIAPHVLDKVHAMLPAALRSKLPSAQAEFEARCERVWGAYTRTSSETSIPDNA
ncbi:MAG: hemerythrin domain-containing protein [Kofleriaceae bacterium]